ncbi:MAG TPA: type II toxin-antitoxin system Phd/YefM family antitoxin [Thermoanaerobaculia bacterium]|nr:type II toxin-antitoxin system Phd/YefM family antitoxin [Thermoanaerobaculia bacterium]
MTAVALSQESEELQELVRRAQSEPIALERDGQAVAVVLSVEDYDRLASRDQNLERDRAYWDEQARQMERSVAEVELTPELWESITTGEYAAISATSQAVPPGWKPGGR